MEIGLGSGLLRNMLKPEVDEYVTWDGNSRLDPDVLGDEPETTPGESGDAEAVSSEPPSVPAQGPIDPPPAPEEEADDPAEEKTIPITGAPPMPQEADGDEDDDVLFPDANDTRKTS